MRWMRAWPLVLCLALVGCGTTASAPPASTGSSPANATATASGSSSSTVKVGTATVKGKKESVLTNSKGMTLYYFTSDTSTKVACTGSCTSLWPPLLSKSGSPTAASSATGKLTVFTDANGKQVLYNGHPLYTYSGDTAPGQANGEGYAMGSGHWWVATPTLAAGSGASSSSGGGW